MRDKRSSCTWAPLRGNSRLLYDCVWIVSASQPWANPASTLDERPGGSKFAPKNSSYKLHLSNHLRFKSRALVGCKSRKHKSFSDTGAQLPVVAARNIQSFANLTTLLCPLLESLRRHRWGALLEDSNLVDPASSHMLVSKTKPCMSKYKCYTVKLRMAQ